MTFLKKIFVLLSFFSTPAFSFSQYFQQEVNYNIDVKLDDVKHELTASETIEYTNNSLNELTFIYFHLWPNAYKNIHTAFAKQFLENGDNSFYFSDEKDKGYIDQLDFRVNGTTANFEIDKTNIDIGKLILTEPLKPGQKITISTPFHVKLPNTFSRLGHAGQQYQITQWYPKPAVYDKDGWHQMPYLDQGEFYSEFGSFDVKITVPKNYVVAATGNLQNEDELKWLSEKAAANEKTLSFPIADTNTRSSPETKTLQYKQNNIHDFSWFCDKRYNVMKSEVELPHSKRKIITWTYFTNTNAPAWKKATKYINDALYHYSLWNGDYPYDNCTAVDGSMGAGGGMEYPTITVISSWGSDLSLEEVVMHEVGHNWFYGILGSNEREHPWMDEGINSFNELRYMETKYPNTTLASSVGSNSFGADKLKYKEQYYLAYLTSALRNTDQPIECHSAKYSSENYGAIVYAKTAMAFNYLKNYLGADTFDKAMQLYFETWKFKHPQPDDLRKIMEEVSGKKLLWFFDDLMKTTKHLDYKIISSRQNTDGSWLVKVKNKGKIQGPVCLSGEKEEQVAPDIWYDGFKGKQTLSFPGFYNKIMVDGENVMPETNRKNNTMRTKGLFKKTEPVKFILGTSFANPNETHIYGAPIIGWNMYNKFMIGAAIHNYTLSDKKFEFIAAPMFSTNSKDLAGYASAFLNFNPSKVFQKISVGFNAARFAYYDVPFFMNFNKVSPEINFIFNNKNARSSVTRSVKIRSVNIIYDTYKGDYSFSPPVYTPDQDNFMINEISFYSKNTRLINPKSLLVKIQQGKGFSKASIETNNSITLGKKKKSFDIRFFAGAFLDNSGKDAGLYRFRTSGWAGYQDYAFDHIFVGRNEADGVLAQQFVENDGGLKVFTPIGQTTKWLMAVNLKSSLPGILPIRLFADIAITDKDARLNEAVHFDGGVILTIAKDVFEIYFPFIMSKDLKDNLKIRDIRYGQQVRFVLNLNKLNPVQAIKDIKLGG